ncbi:filamentous hemagglutinin N-terminal domain-containing protein [Nostoc sp. CHAB 5836]|uniref:two-partner secretion domain-containing protein n=1 Tax=Nostoc sp. CHAB 5836 TaxID=2780404 RepID=UPI001E34149E|nr:filamentous hemagglutinin N-terminal domain-containing protein [Nostoc sp. CHAB 5836]MCC5615245.1 filamentous hemagglutinin N-terminal domain-containing protein [Nostoc sp. CHAB 5836]
MVHRKIRVWGNKIKRSPNTSYGQTYRKEIAFNCVQGKAGLKNSSSSIYWRSPTNQPHISQYLENSATRSRKTQDWWCWCSRFLTLGSCLVVGSVLITSLPERVIAQITSDNSLPNNSGVTRDGNIFNITGGTQAGSNLFHSFSEFSVPTGGTAYFNNTVNIQNIISRVTGGSVSNIDGLIGTLGTANLFLINPSGIIFGANARLDVKGSFVASTANAIGFGDRGFFSASKTESSSSLLTINPSALLFNQIATAPIQNNSANLSVGNNLSLLQVGGNVDINGGSLKAPGGRVELGGLAGEGIVGLNVNGNNLSLKNFPSDGLPASVSLTNGATVDVASGGGGSIAVNAQNINILEGSSLRAGISPLAGFDGAQAGDVTLSAKGTVRIEDSSIYNAVFGLGNGGSLRVDAGKLIIQDGVVATATISSGKAGDLVVNASDSIELTGSSSSNGTINIGIDVPIDFGLFISNIPVGVPVPIGLFSASIDAQSLLDVSGFLSSLPTTSGDAGDLTIETGRLIVRDGAGVSVGSTSTGGTGNLTVKAKDIEISNSSIYNIVFGLGNGGDLFVDTEKLIVQDGVVGTATFSGGDGGDLIVNASDSVELTGSPSSDATVAINIPGNISGSSDDFRVPIGLFSASIDARRFANNLSNVSGFLSFLPTASGDAGDLTIETGRLIVRDGAGVSAGTITAGHGGNLSVKADLIELSGTSANDSPSYLLTTTSKIPSGLRNETVGRGAGGNLTIDTRQLIVRDGAWVTTGTGGKMPGGELTVNASESVELSGTSSENIPTVLASGTQGSGDTKKLVINTKKLMVSNGGIISAGTSSSGNGGELIIKASDSVELVGTSKQGLSASQIQDFIGFAGALVSDFLEDRPFPSGVISGTANTGNAGNLTIETGRLLIQGGAQASVSTINAGNAGDLNVRASSIELSGTSLENPKPNDIVGRSLLTTAVGEGSTGKGGNITVNTNSLTINDGAALTASTSGQKDAGDITLSANTLSVLNDGQLRTSTFGSAQAGDITLNIPEIQLSGSTSGVFAQTSSTGPAGNLTLQPLNGQTLTVNFSDQAQISASTSGSGKGGNLTLSAPESITLNGNGILAATSEGVGSGRAGDVLLGTEKLTIANGMRVSAATHSTNPAASGGNLTVQAAQLNLTNGSSLEAGTTGTAPGGNLTIQPNDNGQTLAVNLTGGATVSAASSGSGKGGTLSVNAPESINVTGNGSVISAETTGEGAGGDLTLTTGKLALQDGAKITVSSTGLGRAGDLKVNANSIYLNNAAKMTADTTGGGGNIFMRSPLMLLGNQSSITTNAQGSGIPGGNINIDTDFLIAFKNSDISANSANFRGGNVRINAQVIFGTRFQNVASDRTSDITATGASPELSGSVEINTPDIDPNSGLVELPTIPVDTQVAQGCYSPGYAQSKFVITGRGGLPPNPKDILAPDAPQIDWVSLKPRNNNRSLPPVTSKTTTSTPGRIVEATGATLNAFGQIILSANSSTVTPHTSRQKPVQCYGS